MTMDNSQQNFCYEQYESVKEILRKEIRNDFYEIIIQVKKCDYIIASSIHGMRTHESLTAAANAHSLFLVAFDLAQSGHFTAIFPLFRTALESAIYGYLFNCEEGLSEKWKKRQLSEDDFNSNKKAFTAAVKRFRGYLQRHDEKSGDTPYEQYIMNLYDAAIDFGAHPNPIGLLNNISLESEGNNIKFSYDYLRTDHKDILKALSACLDYGIAIAAINHLSHIFNNSEHPRLDSIFLDFIKENNRIIDKLNGSPLGFEHRYYNRINNFVPPDV